MSVSNSTDKRVTVWVQKFKDRPNLMLQWSDPFTGQRKSKSAETTIPAVAEMKRTELEYELNHGLHKEASRMSWEKFRELFEDEYVSGKRKNTAKNFTHTFDAFEKHCNPGALRSVSIRTISAFVGALRREPGRHGKPIGESTIKVRLQFLHTALRWAVGQGLIPECPDFPLVKPPRRRPQPVPAESFERLLAKAADPNMHAFLLSGWLAGLRLNEAYSLEREESDKSPYLDLAADRIVFPAGFVKGREDQWIPLDPELREVIEALPCRGKRVFRIVDQSTGLLVTMGYVGRLIAKMAAIAGVRLTFKSLRRGFACRYAAEVPAQVLQRLMRHADIATTLEFYANVDEAMVAAVLGRKRVTVGEK